MPNFNRLQTAFGWLVLAQAAHSVEEYVGRLWEGFPPARYLTGLVSADREVGFLVINIGLVAFGVACYVWPVRRRWRAATGLIWFWVVIQLINGIGHPLWTIRQGVYTPGVLTAPILLALALYLTYLLRAVAPAEVPPHIGNAAPNGPTGPTGPTAEKRNAADQR